MTFDEQFRRGVRLMAELDGEGISDADQVPILGGALVACLLQLDPAERLKCGMAHVAALRGCLGEPE